MKIYIANGLFSEADFLYNELLTDQLVVQGHEVYAPQRNASINDKSNFADSIMIYNGDKEQLDWAEVLVAVIDGVSVDAGVAAEIGYFAAQGKTIVGLYTDSRENSKGHNNAKKITVMKDIAENQFSYVNLFVVGAIKSNGVIFNTRAELLDYLSMSVGTEVIN